MRGWKGNDLGLARWQVQLVHDTAEAVRWKISDMVRDGVPFEEAKRAAIKMAQPAWRGFTPAVAEGVKRVVWSFQFSDIEPAAIKHLHSLTLVDIETMRDRKAGRIERAFFRLTGMSF